MKQPNFHRIAISGASGFIGSALTHFLSEMGHTIIPITREEQMQREHIFWNPSEEELQIEKFRTIDTIIHLAGENIFGLWTARKRELIERSRIEGTRFLIDQLLSLPKGHRPANFFCASAFGIYGDCGPIIVDESQPPGMGFLARVCHQWEQQALRFQQIGRVCLLRFGLVLGADGGILPKLVAVAQRGWTASIGKKDHYLSWITISDLVQIIELLLRQPELQGPINITTPQSVTEAHLMECIKEATGAHFHLRIPATLARLLPGEMGEELLLASTRAYPRVLRELGYSYSHPDLHTAIHELLREHYRRVV